jgi:hypothetical protein
MGSLRLDLAPCPLVASVIVTAARAQNDDPPPPDRRRWDWEVASGELRGDRGSAQLLPGGEIEWSVEDSNRFASGGLGQRQPCAEFLREGCCFGLCDPPGWVLRELDALLRQLGYGP